MPSPIHISTLTGKLENFHAISVNTITNEFCNKMHKAKKKDSICTYCYSWALLQGYRKNVATALERNSRLLSSRLLSIDDELPFINDAYFRFDAHGELINHIHLLNYINIARKNHGCNFALWTKRKDLINRYFKLGLTKPDNLILIYSNPRVSSIMSKPPKYFDRTFNNVLEHEEMERQNCTGQQCKDCLLCYTPNNGVTTIVEKVKSY